MVRRIFVEKKEPYAVTAKHLKHELRHDLGLTGVEAVRVLIRYDVENISDETYKKALSTVFSEPPVDDIYEESFEYEGESFTVEPLPGQFDQRADSAEQCVRLLSEDEEPVIRSAVTYVISGKVSADDLSLIKHHCINPVDSRCDENKKPLTLVTDFSEPEDIKTLEGFCKDREEELKKLYDSFNLAMTFKDFLHIQKYFDTEEHRDPTMTEIRVLDTYWSDHCRHTTFSTELKQVTFGDGYYRKPIEDSYRKYLDSFKVLYKDRDDKYICLMDLALMGMKKLKAEGKLKDQEETDEINACSIVVPVEVDGETEEWLVNFKNETHNHPTEIEPFGGAATCLGGAIRDPLSGRTYVYQAMRVTGAADPTVPRSETLEGKLPQKKLVREAARGYSSYGNQIGLATGYVKEVYHPDYVAKRMEIGAVMGAAPRRAVQRLSSDPGDIIILLGGRTGRDGIGGATGSSKAHNTDSTAECGAEVQKGNPPTERKLQRLFRREKVSHIIKKCNDFGAGGVSVAIGELAPGLTINLDAVPKKYAGLDGTELAISESQERMAVVVDPGDVEQFLAYAAEENLEATEVAVVTSEPRLVMNWRGKTIVDLSRAFLDTNGAHQETAVFVDIPEKSDRYFGRYAIPRVGEAVAQRNIEEAWRLTLSDLNVCSQRGLVEMFDSSIGAGSVFMPYGGKYQLTETQSMVAKLPVQKGDCDTVTMMAYGFDPALSKWSPYHGALFSVTESIARIVAAGGDYKKIRFSFQEYFRRMSEDPHRWSQPFAALLGAYDAQIGFGLPSIGGKDSMSGTFNDIDVPPTLVSFAVDVAKEGDIITPEFKTPGNKILFFQLPSDSYDMPNYKLSKALFETIRELIKKGVIKSAYVTDNYGVAAALSKMAFGNKLGFKLDTQAISLEYLFLPIGCSIIAEMGAEDWETIKNATSAHGVSDFRRMIGEVTDDGIFSYGDFSLSVEEAIKIWSAPLEGVFATKGTDASEEVNIKSYKEKNVAFTMKKTASPKVFIPVFPGTNCEYDSAAAFERAGATPVIKVFRNRNAEDIRDSVEVFTKAIDEAQIVMFPGGFSAGDEPEGSAKFFAAAFRNAKMTEAIRKLLDDRDGLVLGICNGFQALIKLGLVPNGRISVQQPDSPTLTYNTVGRHISRMAYTKVVSNKSPWLQKAQLGGIYAIPASHGEGRFVANDTWLSQLEACGQIATQYVDTEGNATMDELWNLNGSYRAIEGITSPDGRVYGKMCHSERIGRSVAINIEGDQDMHIFESGVAYFE
ncbi:MAG: phosphoribosylformylglycinamidine synthase [Lachnospiraceae bacterium]|nr:phosphoribosylformylglycinamidine synthase [Lachnospiraceae bacterium]